MSRPSTASLSVVPVQALTRIEPPADLTDEELALWTAVVESKPVEWFGEDSAPLLTEYVRAKGTCDILDKRVKDAIEASAGDDPAERVAAAMTIKHFMDMRDKESKRLLSIGTKLRLTQQSRYTPQAAATATKKAGGERPWARQG